MVIHGDVQLKNKISGDKIIIVYMLFVQKKKRFSIQLNFNIFESRKICRKLILKLKHDLCLRILILNLYSFHACVELEIKVTSKDFCYIFYLEKKISLFPTRPPQPPQPLQHSQPIIAVKSTSSIFYIQNKTTKQNYKTSNIILKLPRLRAMTFDKASQ